MVISRPSGSMMTLQALARAAGITTRKAERFLLELANLQVSKDAHTRILKLFPEFFPEALRDSVKIEPLRKWVYSAHPSEFLRYMLFDTEEEIDGEKVTFVPSPDQVLERTRFLFLEYLARVFLPRVWASSDLRVAQWRIFGTRVFFAGQTAPTLLESLLEPPPPTPFEVTMLYLWENFHRTRRCQNPECQATPYFFATKKGQRYCSDGCAGESQREIQRRWWSEHGAQRRKERNKK